MARALVLLFCLAGLPGCQPLAISVLGAGAGTALRYGWDGVTYRTFTAPAEDVRVASLAALERMGIACESLSNFERDANQREPILRGVFRRPVASKWSIVRCRKPNACAISLLPRSHALG